MTRSKKPDIGSTEIISLWPATAEIKSAEINSVNSVANSQKFIPAEITRYTVFLLYKFVIVESILLSNTTCIIVIKSNKLLSPCNSIGGDIVTQPFVEGWVRECVRAWVGVSVTLCLVDMIATTVFAQSLPNFTCKLWMMREEPYWFWVTGSKVKVNFGTLCMRPWAR